MMKVALDLNLFLTFPQIVSVTCLGVLESMKGIFILRVPKLSECRFASTLLRGR